MVERKWTQATNSTTAVVVKCKRTLRKCVQTAETELAPNSAAIRLLLRAITNCSLYLATLKRRSIGDSQGLVLEQFGVVVSLLFW